MNGGELGEGKLTFKMGKAYYLAYYELHEIPWRLSEPIKLEGRPGGIQIQVGRGPYWMPRAASPSVITRAGGARIETVNENFALEGGTYLGIAIPLEEEWPAGKMYSDWDRLSQLADDAAGAVGICFNQRTGLKKVAEYIREEKADGLPRRMEFRWQAFSGARAIVSRRSAESVRRALGQVLGQRTPPQTLLAIRWYEQSKNATVGADRFLSLWIALEALMSPVKDHRDLVRKTAQYLTRKRFGLNRSSGELLKALGLEHMRKARNDIVHRGERLIPWPVANDPTKRDWPQILDDIVGEILRFQLKATLARTLTKHVNDGLGI